MTPKSTTFPDPGEVERELIALQDHFLELAADEFRMAREYADKGRVAHAADANKAAKDLVSKGVFVVRAADTIKAQADEIARRDAVAKAAWGDQEDEHTAAIEAAHPVNTKNHAVFDRALSMVGTRHGKYELVGLVNWLLACIEAAEAKFAALHPSNPAGGER